MFYKKPCLKPSSYTASSLVVTPPCPTSNSNIEPTGSPIHIAAKNKGHRWLWNVFVDDQGFPDQSDKYDMLLHNITVDPSSETAASASSRRGWPNVLFSIQ